MGSIYNKLEDLFLCKNEERRKSRKDRWNGRRDFVPGPGTYESVNAQNKTQDRAHSPWAKMDRFKIRVNLVIKIQNNFFLIF